MTTPGRNGTTRRSEWAKERRRLHLCSCLACWRSHLYAKEAE